MNDAALPLGIREELGGGLDQTDASVGDNELYASQPALLQMPEEAAPALEILFLSFGNAEHLPMTVGTDADRHQHRYVAHLTRPTPLQHDTIEEQVRELALDLAVAPGLDVTINLLIQPRYRARTHPGSPQRLGDVLDPPHAHSRQIHFDQCFLDRRLAPSIALDDRRLERQRTQLRYLERNYARLRFQLPLVAPGARIHSLRRALVARRPADPVGLRLQ